MVSICQHSALYRQSTINVAIFNAHLLSPSIPQPRKLTSRENKILSLLPFSGCSKHIQHLHMALLYTIQMYQYISGTCSSGIYRESLGEILQWRIRQELFSCLNLDVYHSHGHISYFGIRVCAVLLCMALANLDIRPPTRLVGSMVTSSFTAFVHNPSNLRAL